VVKLPRDVGKACHEYQDKTMENLLCQEMSRLVRNVLPFDSLEMTSVDLIQAMLD
jgi:hypothetical protein